MKTVKSDTPELPVCPVCGKRVREISRRTGEAGRKGEYRKWHLACGDRKRKSEGRIREADEARSADRTASQMLRDAWVEKRFALDVLGREVEEYNDEAPTHGRMVVRMVYLLTRQAILMFRIDPMIPIRYGDEFRWLARAVGSEGMDLIADRVRWRGARRWRDDPDVSPKGTVPHTIFGTLEVPGDKLEDEYTGDLAREETMATWKKALDVIWREDNIAGGRGASDPGPWRCK